MAMVFEDEESLGGGVRVVRHVEAVYVLVTHVRQLNRGREGEGERGRGREGERERGRGGEGERGE